MGSEILLRPRPYASPAATFVLLPLLPHRKPVKPLPAETWAKVFHHTLLSARETSQRSSWAWSLLLVCSIFKEIALPILYANIHISNVAKLELFHLRLFTADQKWDSIRRIPYSSPGRWVQVLDISELVYTGQPQALLLDSVLTNIFPLVPHLTRLAVNPSFVLSRRALSSLAMRQGVENIRSLEGLSYVPPLSPFPDEDPFVQLLRCCSHLEELEIIGQGLDPAELEFNFDSTVFPPVNTFKPINFPNLRHMSILSMHASPLLFALLYSPLPSLIKLTMTPFDDIPFPASLVTAFITTHGPRLRSLLLFTPKSWPTRLHPSPCNLLELSPNLNHLSLEKPIPALSLKDTHALQILSLPRPNAESWRMIDRLLPHLPRLSVIRMRDVRWLRTGMTPGAQEAGVQWEMREWKRRLWQKGIKTVDADWNENV